MKRILVVEDDRLLGRELEKALDAAEYAVVWVRTGEEVFEALESEHFDLIYLDILLPEMDGYEVIRKLKGDERWVDIPVVMISNLSQLEEIDKAMELGARDYVVKSNIDLANLVELTKRWMGRPI